MLAGGPRPARRRRGVTLIEMLIVVALVGLLVGVSFPSASAAVDTLRLNAATDSVVSFLNEGLTRADRRQQAVEITVLKAENRLRLRSSEPGFQRTLEMPTGVNILAVLPAEGHEPDAPRYFLLQPGGAVPRMGIEIRNGRNARRIVRVDPILGVPQVERPQ